MEAGQLLVLLIAFLHYSIAFKKIVEERNNYGNL